MRLLCSLVAATTLFLTHFVQAEVEVGKVDIVLPEEVLKKLSPEERETLEGLKKLAGEQLSIALDTRLSPPASIFDTGTKVIPIESLFQAPDNSEVEELARGPVGPDGKPTRVPLNESQWTEVEERALVTVPSKKHPGEVHLWELGIWIQKGREKIEATLVEGKANALRQFIVKVPARWFADDQISVKRGLRNISKGVRDTVGQLVGLIEKKPTHSTSAVYELVNQKRLEQFEQKYGWRALHDEKLMDKALPIVGRLEEEALSEFEKNEPRLRKEYEAELANQGLSTEELFAEVNRRLVRLHQDGFYDRILASAELEKLNAGLGQVLVNRGRAIEITLKHEGDLFKSITKRRYEIVDELTAQYPVRSKVKEWRAAQVEARLADYATEARALAYASIVSDLDRQGLAGEAEIFRANLAFLSDELPGLVKKLSAEKSPAQQFRFVNWIWFPQNWEKKQDKDGRWYAVTAKERTVSTGQLGWRFRNLANGSWTLGKNGTYWLFKQNLWDGPVGLQALGKKEPFLTKVIINPETGELEKGGEPTYTLRARWADLAERNRKEREAFENKPDTGGFGKDFSRVLLNIKQPIVYYGGGSLITGIQGGLTALNTAISVPLGLTAVAWAPVANTLLWGINATVYDTTKWPSRWASFPLINHLLVRTAIRGIGQTVWSGVGGTIWHSAKGTGIYVGEEARAGVRKGYDAIWRRIMKRGIVFGVGRMHIPGRDQRGLITRISGPGLSSNYYFQVSPELVGLAAWARMELERMQEYKAGMQSEVRLSSDRYTRFAEIFGEFAGLRVVYDKVREAEARNLELVEKGLAPNFEFQRALVEIPYRDQIKLTEADLTQSLKITAALAEEFYKDNPGVWAREKLEPGDYVGLARAMLSRAFGDGVLTPFEVNDKTMRLKVDVARMKDYVDDVLNGDRARDLEKYRIEPTWRKDPQAEKPPFVSARELCLSALELRLRD